MHDEINVESSYENLISDFNQNTVFDFISAIFLLEKKNIVYRGTLEQIVYTKGNLSEIYTANERGYIERVKDIIMFAPFYIKGKKHNVMCNILAANLSCFSDPIYASIAFMKIGNKAFNGFNVFVVVSGDKVYLGYNNLEKDKLGTCSLSYPVYDAINWESLIDAFLYIDDSRFNSYYYSLSEAIDSIYDCYQGDKYFDHGIYYFDEENSEYIACANNIYTSEDTNSDEKAEFDNEVLDNNHYLAYIKSNKINTMELLLEAEEADDSNEFDTYEIEAIDDMPSDRMDTYQELLDDPESLIKFLQNKKKL